jgi:hypothetical protein
MTEIRTSPVRPVLFVEEFLGRPVSFDAYAAWLSRT